MENLNKKQKEAVSHIDGPCLVIAGAGSGKTKVVTSRILYLIENGIFEDQILAGAMSQGGDSGSLVLDKDNNAVGLLFAGSNTSTLMNPIQYVLDAFGVEFATKEDMYKEVVKKAEKKTKDKEKSK